MRSLVTAAPRHAVRCDVPESARTGDAASVEAEAVGICGSDVHIFRGDRPDVRMPGCPACRVMSSHVASSRSRTVTTGRLGSASEVAIEPLLSWTCAFPAAADAAIAARGCEPSESRPIRAEVRDLHDRAATNRTAFF
jgi:threonine dehydrogenase-like Zn-dependent dehydrogenase